MELSDHLLLWLQRWAPLWEFLTSVGTVAAVVVALLLASRKPRSNLVVSAVVGQGKFLQVKATNHAETPVWIGSFSWVGPGLRGGQFLSDFGLHNGMGNVALPRQLTTGEWFAVIGSFDELSNAIPPEVKALAEIQDALRDSRFRCATTLGKVFEVSIPRAVSDALARHVELVRRPI